MCGFSVELIDFDQLNEKQKKTLPENYQTKRKVLQAQLEDVSKSIRGIDKALKLIEENIEAPDFGKPATLASQEYTYS